MNLLSSGVSYAGELTIIILCISVIALTLVNAMLVVSLQRRNKKLDKRTKPPAPDEDKPEEE